MLLGEKQIRGLALVFKEEISKELEPIKQDIDLILKRLPKSQILTNGNNHSLQNSKLPGKLIKKYMPNSQPKRKKNDYRLEEETYPSSNKNKVKL